MCCFGVCRGLRETQAHNARHPVSTAPCMLVPRPHERSKPGASAASMLCAWHVALPWLDMSLCPPIGTSGPPRGPVIATALPAAGRPTDQAIASPCPMCTAEPKQESNPGGFWLPGHRKKSVIDDKWWPGDLLTEKGELLGVGRFSNVYSARLRSSGEEVAVKIIKVRRRHCKLTPSSQSP